MTPWLFFDWVKEQNPNYMLSRRCTSWTKIFMKVKIKIRKQKKISKNHKAGVNSIRSIQFKEEQLRQRRFSLFLVSVYIQSTIRTIGLVTIYVNIYMKGYNIKQQEVKTYENLELDKLKPSNNGSDWFSSIFADKAEKKIWKMFARVIKLIQ